MSGVRVLNSPSVGTIMKFAISRGEEGGKVLLMLQTPTLPPYYSWESFADPSKHIRRSTEGYSES